MRSAIALAALAALPSVLAVSLQDFKPRVSGLPAACQLIYIAPIAGCTAGDFSKGLGCSDSCIAGMKALTNPVLSYCNNANLPGNDVLSAYFKGEAVKNQCPNAPDSTTTKPTPTPTPTPTTSSTTDAPATSSDDSTSSTSTTTTTTTSSAVAAATSSSTSTSKGSSTAGSSAQTTRTVTATTAAQATTSPGNVSGGGSPFDTGSSGAGKLSGSASTFALLLSALMAGYML